MRVNVVPPRSSTPASRLPQTRYQIVTTGTKPRPQPSAPISKCRMAFQVSFNPAYQNSYLRPVTIACSGNSAGSPQSGTARAPRRDPVLAWCLSRQAMKVSLPYTTLHILRYCRQGSDWNVSSRSYAEVPGLRIYLRRRGTCRTPRHESSPDA